jgi:hypothetical protein
MRDIHWNLQASHLSQEVDQEIWILGLSQRLRFELLLPYHHMPILHTVPLSAFVDLLAE